MLCIRKEMLKLIEPYHLQDWYYINLQNSLIVAVTCKLPKVFWLGHLTQRGFLARTQHCRQTFWSFLCVTGQLASVEYYKEKVGSVKVIAFPHSRHLTGSGSPKSKYVGQERHICFPFYCSSKLAKRQKGLCLDLTEKQLPDKKEHAVIFSSTPTSGIPKQENQIWSRNSSSQQFKDLKWWAWSVSITGEKLCNTKRNNNFQISLRLHRFIMHYIWWQKE